MDAREIIGRYIAAVNSKHATKNATEHTYRPALERLLQEILSTLADGERISLINEPKRRDFGAPDFELRQGLQVISFIETKDIGGYQPLQKWLLYRRGRQLSGGDIIHFERMSYAVGQTLLVMSQIDKTLNA